MGVDFYAAYATAFKALCRRRVRFVMIGLAAVNCYADDPGSMFSTRDVDILIDATPKNLQAALAGLEGAGFSLECNGEPVVGIGAWLVRRLLERRAVVTAKKWGGARLDVVLESGGKDFPAWSGNSRRFRVAGTSVRVGCLTDLLQAKRTADRDKDRKFLGLYEIQLKEMVDRHDRKRRRA